MKYVDDEFQGLLGREDFLARDEPSHLNHLEVQHVIDQTEEQIALTDDQKNKFARLLLKRELQNLFKLHQHRCQGRAELVRQSHLTDLEHVVVLLLLEHLIA